MNPKTDLDTVDRVTLRAWRVTNILGWGFLGVVAGVALGWVAMNAAFATGFKLTPSLTGPAVFDVVYEALVGVAIGAIVGLHVYRSPGWTAGIAALLSACLFSESGMAFGGGFGFAAGLMLTGVARIVAAVLVARVLWRRRPAALRGR